MIPHPSKADRGGEDAWFVSDGGAFFGVADGVGGWSEVGVDPGLYSRELMRLAREEARGQAPGPGAPGAVLSRAHARTRARGSCTACILCLDGSTLHAANLGDSGFFVLRDGALAFLSPQQQHEFNFPYQIGSPDSLSDSPADAQTFSLALRDGDVVVAATDGAFDNVYPDEAARVVVDALAKANAANVAAPRTIVPLIADEAAVSAASAALAARAHERAADPSFLSPFAYGAQQLGYRFFGGKMDDVTVVVAVVRPQNPAETVHGGSTPEPGTAKL